MSFEDKAVGCRDCGGQFIFTAGEQEFYAQKGFTNEPTRCPLRRQARKQAERFGEQVPPPPTQCQHDVSTGERRPVAPPTYERRERPTSPYANNTRRDDRPFQRPTRQQTYAGPLPQGRVDATVVRIAPAGDYLFARVSDDLDVYVHASLWRDYGPLREGERIVITVEDGGRGPRATTLELG